MERRNSLSSENVSDDSESLDASLIKFQRKRRILSSDSESEEGDNEINSNLENVNEIDDTSEEEVSFANSEDELPQTISEEPLKEKRKRENKQSSFDCTRETSRLHRDSAISLPRYSVPKQNLDEFFKNQRGFSLSNPAIVDASAIPASPEKTAKQKSVLALENKVNTQLGSINSNIIEDHFKLPLSSPLYSIKSSNSALLRESHISLEQSNNETNYIYFDNENAKNRPLEQFRLKFLSHTMQTKNKRNFQKTSSNVTSKTSEQPGNKLQAVQSQLMDKIQKNKETAFEKQLLIQQLDEEDLPDEELDEISEDSDVSDDNSRNSDDYDNSDSFNTLTNDNTDISISENKKIVEDNQCLVINDDIDVSTKETTEDMQPFVKHSQHYNLLNSQLDYPMESSSCEITSYQPGGGFRSQTQAENECKNSEQTDSELDSENAWTYDVSGKYSKYTSNLMKISLGHLVGSQSSSTQSSNENLYDDRFQNDTNKGPLESSSAPPSPSDILPFCTGNFSDSPSASLNEAPSYHNKENEDMWNKRSLLLEDSSDSAQSASDILPFCSGKFTGSPAHVVPEPTLDCDNSAKKNENFEKDLKIFETLSSNPSHSPSDVLPFCSGKFSDTQASSLPVFTAPSTFDFLTQNESQERSANQTKSLSSDDDSFQDDIIIRRKRTRQIKLVESEDEDDGVNSGCSDGSIGDKILENDRNESENDCSDEKEDDSDHEAVDYENSDDEHAQLPTFQKDGNDLLQNPPDVIQQYFDKEAELSGEEVSDDEDDEEDEYDKEEIDTNVPSNEKIRSQIGALHAKQIMDDDIHALKLLKEQLFEDGELHTDGPGRNRKFTWINKDDGALNDSNEDEDVSDSENDMIKNEDKWAAMHEEMLKWRHEQKKDEDNMDVVESPLDKTRSQFKLDIIGKKEEMVYNDELDTPGIPELVLPSKRKRGSILSREEVFATTLKRLKGSDCDPYGSRTTKHFVFRNDENEDNSMGQKSQTKVVHKPIVKPIKKTLVKDSVPTSSHASKSSIFEHL